MTPYAPLSPNWPSPLAPLEVIATCNGLFSDETFTMSRCPSPFMSAIALAVPNAVCHIGAVRRRAVSSVKKPRLAAPALTRSLFS
jgi:hypothetical protein